MNKIIPNTKRANSHLYFKCYKLTPKSKRAQGHVEMMLSFILFIGAILFIFVYLNPFSKSVDSRNELEQVQRIIMQQISDNAGRLSVVSYDNSGCYKFDNSQYPANYVEFAESVSKKYTIYFSNKFTGQNAPHKIDSCGDASYKLGVFSNETIILYDLLKNFAASCNSDLGYQQKKKDLGLSLDFALNITDMNRQPIGDLNFAKKVSAGVEVKSKEFPIKIVKEDGTIINAIFNVKVW